MPGHELGTVLVTGGAGFIGSSLIRCLLRDRPGCRVVNYDLLTYAGDLRNVAGLDAMGRYEFVHGDICDRPLVLEILRKYSVDTIINCAAETHVDRSIRSSTEFVRTNVVGTQTLLDAALEAGVGRFVQVSTDEVYGSLGPEGAFLESSPLAPNNPYAASKAAADLLCRAYHHTYRLPVVVTRSSNNYGPRQFPEKLIPRMILLALDDEELPVYGDGLHVRNWLHVDDHARALLAAAERGEPGAVYNVGSGEERANIEIVHLILEILQKANSLVRHIEDRPGHDRRYALDSSKAWAELDWRPSEGLESGLRQTVAWYRANRGFWEKGTY